jgi:hypothetical protein
MKKWLPETDAAYLRKFFHCCRFLRTSREFLVVFLDDWTNQTYMCFMEGEFLSGIARTFL